MTKTSELAAATSDQALTLPPKGAEVVLPGGLKVRMVKAVSRPTLKQETGESVYFTVTDPIRSETNLEKKIVKIDGADREIEEEKTIHVVAVRNLTDGRDYNYVLNAVTHGELTDNYPDNGYVGRSFAIQKGAVVAGKRFKAVSVIEIETDGEVA